MSWYATGYEAPKQEEERQQGIRNIRRFRMGPTENKDLVFIDDEPFCIHEHNPKIGQTFDNPLTCLRGIEDEVACCEILGHRSRYFVGYYTVVDCSRFESQRGNVYQYELKLLPAKLQTINKLKRKKEGKGLIGQLYNAARDGQKTPRVGDDFEHLRPTDLDKLFPLVNIGGRKLSEILEKAEQTGPGAMAEVQKALNLTIGEDGKFVRKIPTFNYFELLKPMSSREVRSFLKGYDPEDQGFGGGGGGGGAFRYGPSSAADGYSSDDVPF